jgi:hypothetical protein
MISVEEYTKRYHELKMKSKYPDENDTPVFDSLDDEIEFIRLRKTFVQHYAQYDEYRPCEFIIIDLPEESKRYSYDIRIVWKYGNVISEICEVNLEVFVHKMLIVYYEKYKDQLDPAKDNKFGRNDSIEYAKINGHYLQDFKEYKNRVFRGTLSECENKLDIIVANMDITFRREINGSKIPITYNGIISDLKEIKSYILDIKVKQVSDHGKRMIISRISGMIDKYEKQLV